MLLLNMQAFTYAFFRAMKYQPNLCIIYILEKCIKYAFNRYKKNHPIFQTYKAIN